MTDTSRLDVLPGYDTAPDVYETPDIHDDTSTVQTSRTSPTDTEATSDEDEDDSDSYGVSRRRLYPARARSQFNASSRRVGTKNVDLSDRIDGKRKGLKVRPRAPNQRDEDGSLEARIARLKREIEECKLEVEREKEQQDSEDDGDEDGQETTEAELDGLGKILQSIEVPAVQRDQRKAVSRDQATGEHDPPDDELRDEQTLARVTAFDTRITELEQALGLSTLDAANGADAVSTPVLPSLTALDHQLAALTTATSLTNLEAASTRLRTLRAEADQTSQNDGITTPANGDPESTTKLRQLYTLLPTLQTLTPTIPALLSRLRSLRSLHTSAASAMSELERVEQRQAEMDEEVAEWRKGLERVEEAVREAGEGNGRNALVVQGWVRELEGRVRGL
ncbi:hypothetical protein LTR62_004229 [Meristemomyces frigidus]|uniref:Dynactin subunit n=1 Tax=Meristemomyces frigidus TaxID=1508187 RepID=A0AAN7TIS9_9PEZI|nr:hypothetical protein LTR62_004229 [Meristemomyces frigidus]